MSYIIQWDNAEKTVVLQQYTDNPIKDDLYHLAEESALMLKSVPHTVHLIIDERTSKLTLSSADINFLERTVPSNQGTVVMVVSKSGQSYKKLMQNVGKTLAPNAFKQNFFVTTVEEARQLLQDQFKVNYSQIASP